MRLIPIKQIFLRFSHEYELRKRRSVRELNLGLDFTVFCEEVIYSLVQSYQRMV